MTGEKARVRGANRGTVLAGALIVATVLASGLGAMPAQAQQAAASAPTIAQLQSERSFEIPAQPLTDALVAFGQQSGIQVTVDGNAVRNVSSPAVRGTMTSEQALRQLLAGSGLTYTMSGSTVAIEKPGQAGSDGTTMLGPITVQADGIPSQAEIGNLPPPYAGGQVATGSKLGILGNRDFMDTPFNQTSYTSKLIQDQQARSLGEVLKNDPSVYMDNPAGSRFENPQIRGFSVGAGDVAFGGLWGIAPTINSSMASESIERVELLKGPSALLNGMSPSGSIGGAINIVPKRAGDKPLAQFTPSYASDTQLGGHIDIGRRFGPDNNFGVRFNSAYRNGDTAIDRESRETQLAALAIDFRSEVVRLSADVGYQSQHIDTPRYNLALATNQSVPDAPNNRSNWQQPWAFEDHEFIYGMVRGELDLADNLTAHVAVGGQRWLGNFLSETLILQNSQGLATSATAANPTNMERVALDIGLRGSLSTGPVRHDLSVANSTFWEERGSAVRSFTLPNNNFYNPVFVPEPSLAGLPSPEDAPKTSDRQLTGFAFADTLSVFDDRVQLTVGVRRQQVNTDTFSATTGARTSTSDKSAISPAFGLLVKPLSYLSLYGNHIEGLSPGSIAPATSANAGEVFPPMKTKQSEIGMKLDFGQLAMTFSAFDIKQPNAFTDPATNVFGVDGEQRNRGLELTFFGEVTQNIRILGGITYVDAELTKTRGGVNEGNRPSGVPDYRANLGGEWDTPFVSGLTLSANAIYASSRYLDQANRKEVPSWTRFDLGARYSIETSGIPITIRANVLNVLNADYWEGSSLISSTPRTFLLSASFNF